MGVQRRYLQAVLGVRRHGTDARELTPSVLAAAAVAVLPVTAAGISLSQAKLRVPLGWSNNDAALAERQQTTLGDGPCLWAAATGAAVIADADAIAHQWPAYWREIEKRTPFRSVAALPLRVQGQPVLAALDLYAERPDLASILKLDEAETVAATVADLLFGMLDDLYDGDERSLPRWIDQQAAIDRVAVWTAVGMMIAAADLSDADALARLRAFARSNDLTLDAAATRLVDRQLPVRAVLG
jgi:hypothetical protein